MAVYKVLKQFHCLNTRITPRMSNSLKQNDFSIGMCVHKYISQDKNIVSAL